jgi:hypothetical protein
MYVRCLLSCRDGSSAQDKELLSLDVKIIGLEAMRPRPEAQGQGQGLGNEAEAGQFFGLEAQADAQAEYNIPGHHHNQGSR